MVPAGAVTDVGTAKALASTVLIACPGDDELGFDRDSFGICISRKNGSAADG
jgi:hypothetical protein